MGHNGHMTDVGETFSIGDAVLRPGRMMRVERDPSILTDMQIMELYLDMKRRRKDWHGVRDACVDIEIMETEERTGP